MDALLKKYSLMDVLSVKYWPEIFFHIIRSLLKFTVSSSRSNYATTRHGTPNVDFLRMKRELFNISWFLVTPDTTFLLIGETLPRWKIDQTLILEISKHL